VVLRPREPGRRAGGVGPELTSLTANIRVTLRLIGDCFCTYTRLSWGDGNRIDFRRLRLEWPMGYNNSNLVFKIW